MKKLLVLFSGICLAILSPAQIKRPDCLPLQFYLPVVYGEKCYGLCDGTASVTLSNGTPPYTYLWSNGSTQSAISALCIGSYSIVVTDKNGCTGTTSITITQPARLLVIMGAPLEEYCNGGVNGIDTTLPIGGTPPYFYNWLPSGGNNQVANNLSAGTYTLTVTDANGCTATNSITITQPAQLVETFSVTANASCHTCPDGSIYAPASGGTLPYSYLWTPGGYTTDSVTGLTAGNYTVSVTDANGCIATAYGFVITGLVNISNHETGFNIYPNPCSGTFAIEFSANENAANAVMEIYDMVGQLVQSESIEPSSGINTREVDISKYGKGVYFVIIKNGS